jgi:hypothetical protein
MAATPSSGSMTSPVPERTRIQPPEHAVRSPVLRQLYRRPVEIAIILLQLGLKFLEESESIGCGPGEPGDDLIFVEPSHLPGAMLYHRVPVGHLPVPGHGDFSSMTDSDDRSSHDPLIHKSIPFLHHRGTENTEIIDDETSKYMIPTRDENQISVSILLLILNPSLCPLCLCGERFLFCARVRFIVNLHKFIHTHMGVTLGGREAHMTQHFLDGPQVRTRIQQMGGEGMAKGMGAHLSQETALQHVFLQDPRHAPGRQAGSPGVDE